MPDRWGIEASYTDATGLQQTVSDRTVERLRGIIGEPRTVSGPLVVGPEQHPDLGAGDLVLEDGTVLTVRGTMPDEVPLGYHVFTDDSGTSRDVIVSPRTCHLQPGRRAWGWVAQLYATRSSDSWGIGDLGDLRRLATWSNGLGAGFVLVNPIGAVAPGDKQQASPYFPASRRYRNPLYLRIEEVPGAADAADTVERAAAAGRALNDRREIDRDSVWRIKQTALEAIWRTRATREEFDRWYQNQPRSLREFATWSALVELLGPKWREWPFDFRHPDGRGVATAGDAHADRIRFHAWLQWLVEIQLGRATQLIPIVQDLPIGFDPDGFDAWAWQDIVALDASVGAPPDAFNRNGQHWGLPPFIPWKLREANYRP
ncbi:MAG TPA: 4-alpha-glucanotransferase, partial [Ilumatobacteraceae bacterium]|nr:4-alpha-glucanotransferase [Ilumatobacteraceae bacterium]